MFSNTFNWTNSIKKGKYKGNKELKVIVLPDI